MHKQALYYEHTGSNRKVVCARGPEILRNMLKKQERTLKKASIKFEAVIPELKQMMKNPAPYSFVHCHRGIEGVQRVFLDTVNSSEEVYGFALVGQASLLETAIPKKWVQNVYRRRKVENEVRGKYLCPDLPAAQQYIRETYEKEGVLQAAPAVKRCGFTMHENMSFCEMVTYQDKVALIAFDERDKMGVLIKSPLLAHTFRVLFDGAWHIAK
jgi:hypothetical protein